MKKALKRSEQSQNKFCPIANHLQIYADHTCTIEDCKSESRQCCLICIQQKLHIRDTDYDLYKIYPNTKIEEVILKSNFEYQGQYYGFLADYYYEQLVALYFNSSQQNQEKFQALLKSIKCLSNVLTELTYENYRKQLEASNISLNQFLNIFKNSFAQTELSILDSFISLRNLIQYKEDELNNQEQIFQNGDVLAQILEDLIQTYKYQNGQFTNQQQNFIKKCIEVLCNISPKLGKKIIYLSNKLSKQFYRIQQFNCINDQNQQLQDLETQIHQNPNNDQLYYQKGVLLWENKYINEAIKNIQIAIQINPQLIYFTKLGMIMKNELNNYEQANYYYDQAINLNSKEVDLYIQKGNILNAMDKYEDEIKLYYDALNIHSHNLNLHYLLGNALLQQEKYDEAIKVCERAFNQKKIFLQQDGENEKFDEDKENYKQLYILQAQCLQKTKQYKSCNKICNEAILKYNNESQFYKIKGICMLNMNDEENAIKIFQALKKRDPSLNVELLQIQGEYYFQQKSYQLAQNFYKTLIKKEPFNSNYQINYALILESLEKYDEAIQTLKKCIAYIPNDESLEQLLEKIQSKYQQQNLQTRNNSNQNQPKISNSNNQNKRRKNKKNNQQENGVIYNDQVQNEKIMSNSERFEETPAPDLNKSKYLNQGENYQTYLVQSEYISLGDIGQKQNDIIQFENTPTPAEPDAIDEEIKNYKQICQQGMHLIQQKKYSKGLEKFEQALEFKPQLYKRTQSKELILDRIMQNDQLLEMCDKILQLQEIK